MSEDARSAGNRTVSGWETRVLNVFAVLIIVMMVIIALQVLLSILDVNPVLTFSSVWPLFGRAVTLNSLLDFQWHLLVLIVLLPCAIAWRRDAHVRVDFIYVGLSARRRATIELVGHLFLTAPFIAMIVPAAWSFMMRAWTSSEMSANGGLTDRFLVKAVLPLGFALLGVVLLLDLPKLARRIAARKGD